MQNKTQVSQSTLNLKYFLSLLHLLHTYHNNMFNHLCFKCLNTHPYYTWVWLCAQSYLHEWRYLLVDTLWSCISCSIKCNQGIDPAGHRKNIKFLVIKEKEKATTEEKRIYIGTKYTFSVIRYGKYPKWM